MCTVVHSQKFMAKNCAGCSSCAKFWANRISTAVIYYTDDILRWMLKLSKFGAYTAQKLAQLGEKNSTSALAVLVAFCISGCPMRPWINMFRNSAIRTFSSKPIISYSVSTYCRQSNTQEIFIGPRYPWSDLCVRMSLRQWDTFVKLNWCYSGWWRYQVNTNW